jgi:hypothetical protein
VILKSGGCALIIATTAINFDLLSEKEQEATIYAYAGLLNSLTFPVQIAIRSQRKDISSYLKLLEETEAKTSKPKIKEQIKKYRAFIQETVQKNNVLDKKFFIIIPLSLLELGVTKTLAATLGRKRTLPFDKQYILERAKVNLYPKRDHLLRLLARLGLKGRQLTSKELIQLFFSIYNPEAPGQPLTPAEEYKAPLVSSAPIVGKPSPPEETNIRNQINNLVKESSDEYSVSKST